MVTILESACLKANRESFLWTKSCFSNHEHEWHLKLTIDIVNEEIKVDAEFLSSRIGKLWTSSKLDRRAAP